MSDQVGDLPDFQAPLGKFSNRRSSIIFSAKLIEKWSERPENKQPEGQSSDQPDDGCKKPGTISFSNFEEYTPDNLNKAIIMGPDMDDKTECRPCKMSVDDMTEVLFECINEESLRREALTGVAGGGEPPGLGRIAPAAEFPKLLTLKEAVDQVMKKQRQSGVKSTTSLPFATPSPQPRPSPACVAGPSQSSGPSPAPC